MPKYIVAFGGNEGDVESTIKKVLLRLEEKGSVLNVSSLYSSKPLPTEEIETQSDFVNGVLEYDSVLEPQACLEFLLEVERDLGRDREESVHWGPRKIDLDIIAADNVCIESRSLTIPHPRYKERDFVLIPLQEICSLWRCPETGEAISTLIENLDTTFIFAKKPLN